MKSQLLLCLSLFVWASTSIAQPCNCRKNFDFLAEKIRLNYAGYRDKVTTNNQAEFEQFTAKHRQMADTAATETSCFRVLSDWDGWFKDRPCAVEYRFFQMPKQTPQPSVPCTKTQKTCMLQKKI